MSDKAYLPHECIIRDNRHDGGLVIVRCSAGDMYEAFEDQYSARSAKDVHEASDE